jgi:uncharacterized caspase-like protein/tetratricopeptide (TPR) repeat protein
MAVGEASFAPTSLRNLIVKIHQVGDMMRSCLFIFLCFALALPRASAEKYAVLVGIDEYQHAPQLAFAANDTAWLASTLIASGGFARDNVFPLTTNVEKLKALPASEGPPLSDEFWQWLAAKTQTPTKAHILAALETLKTKVRAGDTVMFYFSGHGMVADGKGFLAPVEADPSSVAALEKTCLPAEAVTSALRTLPARAILIIFDACRNDPGKSLQKPVALDGVLSRDLRIVPAQAQTEVAATLFSCQVGQQSFEWPEKSHGVFSYFLARGLLGAAADAEGEVTLASLQEYLEREVAPAAQKINRAQTPWFAAEGTRPASFPLSWPGLLPPGTAPAPSTPIAKSTRAAPVLIPDFINSDDKADVTGAGISDGVARQLSENFGTRVVERSTLRRLQNALASSAQTAGRGGASREWAQLLGAEYYLLGDWARRGDDWVLRADLRRVADGDLVKQSEQSGRERAALETALARDLAAALGAPSTPPVNAPSLKGAADASAADNALFLLEAGSYAAAFRAYVALSDAQPDELFYHRQLEKCAKLGNLTAPFLERYTALAEAHPENAIFHNYLGNALLMLDARDAGGKAREQYETTLRLDPNFAPALNNLGILEFRQGRAAAAIARFKEYLAAMPRDAVGWANLGLIHVARVEKNPTDTDAVREAESDLTRAIELQPSLASAHKGVARLALAQGHKAEALAAFERSLMLNREQPDVRAKIEALRWELGASAGAASGSTPATGAGDDLETRAGVQQGAQTELASGTAAALAAQNWDKAEALARALVRLAPGNALSWQMLGQSLTGAGRTAEAQTAFDEAARLEKLHTP